MLCYTDNDGDGFGSGAGTLQCAPCAAGTASNPYDVDDNCNGAVDECGNCTASGSGLRLANTCEEGDTVTVNSTSEAVNHYFGGSGKPADVGQEAKDLVHEDEDFLRVLNKLKDGTAENRSLTFDIHFEDKVFHIGDSNIDYNTSCTESSCTTEFSAFVRDEFKDPLDIGVEVPGGKPYDYVPYEFSESYPNPGYPVGTNIP